MGLFNRTQKQYTPNPGVSTAPQQLVKSVPFVFDGSNQPAVSLEKVSVKGSVVDLTKSSEHVSLVKSHQAAEKALTLVDLPGIRMEVVVLVDGSGSMSPLYGGGHVQKMLIKALGFGLNVDADGQIPVIVYGHGVSKPVVITPSNYLDAPNLIKPDMGYTNMGDAMEEALKIVEAADKLVLIINITDGNPYGKPDAIARMDRATIKSSGYPCMLKNLAVASVPYLEQLDDMPSQIEIDTDASGNPVRDANDNLVLSKNPQGIRLIDNVDSKAINPLTASEDEWAAAFADELGTCIEVMARVGHLTGVPGFTKEF